MNKTTLGFQFGTGESNTFGFKTIASGNIKELDEKSEKLEKKITFHPLETIESKTNNEETNISEIRRYQT